MPVDPVRDAAVGILLRVFEEGAYLSIALDKTLRRTRISERGRRFLTQLVYGTVRQKLLCDYVLTPLLRQPLKELPHPVLAILRMGVCQSLFCDSVTFPAMVHTSVELAKKRSHAGMARLVNAVLRKVPESLDDVALPNPLRGLAPHLSVRYSMPEWLVEQWLQEYGTETAERLCAASNSSTPAALRANTLVTTAEQLIAGLTKAGFTAVKRTPIPEEVTILDGPPPARAKLFQQGHFLIQDPASMLSAHLLEPRPGERVLDLCAAPGGKTTHLAQLAGGEAHITAMDLHAGKLKLVRENASRLNLPGIHLVRGDGRRSPLREGFDKVLVDAPCTGLGTLRRHPDLKWRARPEDARVLAELQRDLLRCGTQLCKNGGLVVYSVCTFSRHETDEVIQPILAEGCVTPEDGPAWLELWRETWGQYRILPQTEGLDGFFLMRLRKAS